MNELVLTNARIVGREEVFLGTVHTVGGAIESLSRERSYLPAATNLEGDLLLPGLVDIHTDALERHMEPRPGVRWPVAAALQAHDRQMAGCGITTVLDALCVGVFGGAHVLRRDALLEAGNAVMAAQRAGDLKADHRLHLRCELGAESLMEALEDNIDNPLLQVVSVMDHTPGQRQWHDLERWRTFYSRRHSEEKLQEILADRLDQQGIWVDRNRAAVVSLCHDKGHILASHDDTTEAHVRDAHALGIHISEFPTTIEAARTAHECGMVNVLGGPNVVQGGSHSGNVAARDLAREDLLDGIASDYVPISMIHAAFLLHHEIGRDLPSAVATISANPTRMVGLTDRGEIAPSKRADLIRVVDTGPGNVPVVRTVWREGVRIA